MPQIELNPEESMRILANPDASPDSRIIAGCAVALFESSRNVDDIKERNTLQIALKVLHLAAAEIYSAD